MTFSFFPMNAASRESLGDDRLMSGSEELVIGAQQECDQCTKALRSAGAVVPEEICARRELLSPEEQGPQQEQVRRTRIVHGTAGVPESRRPDGAVGVRIRVRARVEVRHRLARRQAATMDGF